jgi:hypothetical protein
VSDVASCFPAFVVNRVLYQSAASEGSKLNCQVVSLKRALQLMGAHNSGRKKKNVTKSGPFEIQKCQALLNEQAGPPG